MELRPAVGGQPGAPSCSSSLVWLVPTHDVPPCLRGANVSAQEAQTRVRGWDMGATRVCWAVQRAQGT